MSYRRSYRMSYTSIYNGGKDIRGGRNRYIREEYIEEKMIIRGKII